MGSGAYRATPRATEALLGRGDIPGEIFSGDIETFVSFSCKFSGALPNTFGGLLKNLVVSSTDSAGAGIKGTLPRSLLNSANVLEMLYLVNNEISGTPAEFFSVSYPNLHMLALEGNLLSGTLPSDLSIILPAAAEVWMGANGFSGSITATFSDLTEAILLDNNLLTGFVPTFPSKVVSNQLPVCYNVISAGACASQ